MDRWTGGQGTALPNQSPAADHPKPTTHHSEPPLRGSAFHTPENLRPLRPPAPLPRRRSGSTFRPGPDAPARPGFPSRHDHAHRNPRRSRRPRRRPVDGRRDAADSPLDHLRPRPRRQLPRRVPLLALHEPESRRARAMPHRAGGRRRGRGVRVGIGGDDDAPAGPRTGLARHRPRRRLLRHDQARARRPRAVGTRAVDRRHDGPRAACARRCGRTRKLVWVETPSNPLLRVVDIAAVAAIAHEGGALCAVDNTWGTPVLQRPLELGADVSMHATTKYLGGHSDVLGGALVFREIGDLASAHRRDPDDRWRRAVAVRVLAHAARHSHAADSRPRAERERAGARDVPREPSVRRSGALSRAVVAPRARNRAQADVRVRRNAVRAGGERSRAVARDRRPPARCSRRRRVSAARRAWSSTARRSRDRARARPRTCFASRWGSSTSKISKDDFDQALRG